MNILCIVIFIDLVCDIVRWKSSITFLEKKSEVYWKQLQPLGSFGMTYSWLHILLEKYETTNYKNNFVNLIYGIYLLSCLSSTNSLEHGNCQVFLTSSLRELFILIQVFDLDFLDPLPPTFFIFDVSNLTLLSI